MSKPWCTWCYTVVKLWCTLWWNFGVHGVHHDETLYIMMKLWCTWCTPWWNFGVHHGETLVCMVYTIMMLWCIWCTPWWNFGLHGIATSWSKLITWMGIITVANKRAFSPKPQCNSIGKQITRSSLYSVIYLMLLYL